MINLITLAGEGSRFADVGIDIPKPLIEVDGKPMLIQSISCLPDADSYVFVCRSEHIEKYGIDEMIKDYYPKSEFVTLNNTTMGQACTAEIGILQSSIQNDDSVLISCCDYGLEWSKQKYEEIKKGSDVVVWSTINNRAFSNNPSSYSWLETKGTKLIRTHVKQNFFDNPYVNHAIVGTFFFKQAGDFLNGVSKIYQDSIKSNGEYYIDNIFNSIDHLNVNIFDVDKYHCWGTPEDLRNYENRILG
tara:strand:+ start:803 stop:1540 length:738 start_codon:yes stop_codon:yes gene_type:complete